MYTIGPNYISPYTGGNLVASTSQTIPFTVGKDGIAEVVNLTNFGILVTFDVLGTVFQEARSKCMYRCQQAAMGPQTVTVSTPVNGTFPGSPRYIRLPVAYQNGVTGLWPIFLNIYQAGEVEWSPPVSIANPPAQSCYSALATITTSGTLVLPTTDTFFNNVPSQLGTVDLLGFDLTSNASGAGSGNLVISNIHAMPDGSTTLNYQVTTPTVASGTTFVPFNIRFPAPLPNALGFPITFTLSGLSSGVFQLVAYYSLT
jgi:hypothetical protein